MAFRTMVDMAKSPAEKVEDMMPQPMSAPDYPYGLCLCLTQDELDKLGLDAECEVGDMIHLFAMATVTSVSKRDTGNGPECRLELQVTHLGLEDEDTEDGPSKRYGKDDDEEAE